MDRHASCRFETILLEEEAARFLKGSSHLGARRPTRAQRSAELQTVGVPPTLLYLATMEEAESALERLLALLEAGPEPQPAALAAAAQEIQRASQQAASANSSETACPQLGRFA
ncbi:hypothetical protein ABPG75_009358 [Micractinium tetrahymenae]